MSEHLYYFVCVVDDAVNMVFELIQTVGQTCNRGSPDGTLIVGLLHAHRFVEVWGVPITPGMQYLTALATALPNRLKYGALDMLCR